MPGPYDTGDLVRITGTFKDLNGNFIDPSAIFFKYKNPLNVITTYTYGVSNITRASIGIYFVDIPLPLAGTYNYRFYSTGTGQAAKESSLVVRPTYTG